MNQEIRLPDSPYAFVRITVMRTLLIPSSDYKKLLMMGFAEISSYLGETPYKDDINHFGINLSGIELIEQALNRNFTRTVQKLKRISPEAYSMIINAYLLRHDIENIKTIIRTKKTGQSPEYAKGLFIPGAIAPLHKLESLMEKGSVEEILKALPSPLNTFYRAYRKREHTKDLAELETALDHFYYSYMLTFSSRIPKQEERLREFLLAIIDAANMLTYLRLKRENLPNNNIKKHMFLDTENRLFKRLLKTGTQEEMLKIIKASKYAPIIDMITEGKSLIPVEIFLSQSVYRKTLLFSHKNPLSVDVLLGYLFAKEIEIMNLKKILKAKILGINAEKVEPQLVIA